MKSTWQRVPINVATFALVSLVGLWPVFAASSREARPPQESQPEQKTAQHGPSIQIKERSYDFGEAMEGAEITHVFVVKNTGKAALQITQVRPG